MAGLILCVTIGILTTLSLLLLIEQDRSNDKDDR